MVNIGNKIKFIHNEISSYALKFNRNPNDVRLLAVSKKHSIANIEAAYQAGQRQFGESYLQEALPKINALTHLEIIWHYIGAIQSNKTKIIAENFNWVQSVDRLKIAERLNAQRPAHLPRLNICIEVNIDDEPQKSGVSLLELSALAQAISKLPNLHLCGLMAIPAPRNSFEQQRIAFKKLHTAFEQLKSQGLVLDTLSMGMSDDFAAAIAEGSTIVRIGTRLFGKRG